ncbi:hypothetical protein [Pantoea sp. 18069]|uniref:hypothetical protein n=1 Tax=Pantoea sp. 18069 TaxID=2681415 RepID=UPI00135706DD|nr:hypothetical protein [Pantoea sp. 18069]
MRSLASAVVTARSAPARKRAIQTLISALHVPSGHVRSGIAASLQETSATRRKQPGEG